MTVIASSSSVGAWSPPPRHRPTRPLRGATATTPRPGSRSGHIRAGSTGDGAAATSTRSHPGMMLRRPILRVRPFADVQWSRWPRRSDQRDREFVGADARRAWPRRRGRDARHPCAVTSASSSERTRRPGPVHPRNTVFNASARPSGCFPLPLAGKASVEIGRRPSRAPVAGHQQAETHHDEVRADTPPAGAWEQRGRDCGRARPDRGGRATVTVLGAGPAISRKYLRLVGRSYGGFWIGPQCSPRPAFPA